MSAEPAQPDRRRRFRPARRPVDPWAGEDSFSQLEAEVVLLREENARLKLADHHGRSDLAGLLGHARAVREATLDHDDSATDETTQMFVEALVIRESLMEICRALERSMVAYQAKLDALLDATVQERQAHTGVTHTNGNGPELA